MYNPTLANRSLRLRNRNRVRFLLTRGAKSCSIIQYMRILLILITTVLTGCAGPVGIAYTATSVGSLATTGQTPTEHMASRLTDSDCSIWNAVVDLAYICEYNKNPGVTYNRNPF